MTTSDALPVEAAVSLDDRTARTPVWRAFLRPVPAAAAVVVAASVLAAVFAPQLNALSDNDPFT